MGRFTPQLASEIGSSAFSDPKKMLRHIVDQRDLFVRDGASNSDFGTAATYTTYMARAGEQLDSNWTDGVYKELLSSNEPTDLIGVVGPANPSGSGTRTTSLRVTVDGKTPVVISVGDQANYERAVWGNLSNNSAAFTTAFYNFNWFPPTLSSDDRVFDWTAATNVYLLGLSDPHLNLPFLRAEESLLVEMAYDADHSTSSLEFRRSAIAFRKWGNS